MLRSQNRAAIILAPLSGAYIVVDGAVTLTTREGEPVRDESGKLYRHTLQPGEHPKAIAARMTKKLRLMLRNKNGPSDFNRPIVYPNVKHV